MELDLTKPDTGRIMDYFLGGHHNFEVDRAAAAKMAAFFPDLPTWMRSQRRYLGVAVQKIWDEGIKSFLVAGAGLPTCRNVHEVVPNAKVLYTDISAVTVAYGRHIVGDNPLVRYISCNAVQLRSLDGAAEDFLNTKNPFAIVLIGIAHFLPDPVLVQMFRDWFEWMPSGSKVAANFLSPQARDGNEEVFRMYEQMGAALHTRSRDQIRTIIGPWQLDQDGIVPLLFVDDEGNAGRSPELAYGCVCVKP